MYVKIVRAFSRKKLDELVKQAVEYDGWQEFDGEWSTGRVVSYDGNLATIAFEQILMRKEEENHV